MEQDHTDQNRAINQVAEAIRDPEKQVVVIVGSGASADSGIPTGRQIGEILEDADKNILCHELGEDPQSWNFFDIVDVLVNFRGEEYVQSELKRMLQPKFISLGYEILAHYLHHGQIKAVVSLNHDRAFDRSLDLESPNFKEQARSRSEFDALLEKLSGSNKLPQAYLKVHGCVSRKMTFRINRGSVARLEAEKLGVLKNYCGRSNLILCIGWSMHDPDVFRPLADVFPNKGKKLIVVDMELPEALETLVTGLGGRCCKSDAYTFLSKVGDVVEGSHGADASIQSIGLHRHRIRALCFDKNGLLKTDPQIQAAIEVIMFALKARAQIEPRTLFECSRTSHLLARAGEKSLHNSKGQKSRPTEEAQVKALAEILDKLTKSEILNQGNVGLGAVYWLRSSHGSNLNPRSISADSLLENIANYVVNRLKKHEFCRNGLGKDSNKPDLWNNFETHLAALTKAFDVDLIPRASDFAMFSEPQIITSKKDFEDKTNYLLNSISSGMTLRVSTNTGEWIAKNVEKIPTKEIAVGIKCRVLVEDYQVAEDGNPFKKIAEARTKQTESELKKRGINTKVKQVGNKVHQLTAIIDNENKCHGAIYFRREGKSTRISPVWLTGEQDLARVCRIWTELWPKDPQDQKA